MHIVYAHFPLVYLSCSQGKKVRDKVGQGERNEWKWSRGQWKQWPTWKRTCVILPDWGHCWWKGYAMSVVWKSFRYIQSNKEHIKMSCKIRKQLVPSRTRNTTNTIQYHPSGKMWHKHVICCCTGTRPVAYCLWWLTCMEWDNACVTFVPRFIFSSSPRVSTLKTPSGFYMWCLIM